MNAKTSLPAKLMYVFVSPGVMFDEVASAQPNLPNWLVPTLLVALAGSGPAGARLVSAMNAGLAAFAGVLWSGLVLWFIGRVFLKTRFPILKAVEVAGLTSMILALGALVTALLVGVSGDPTARPAMSLFMNKSIASPRVYGVLDVVNLFHLWTTAVLAMGLARLSGVSFKEAAFWVFGYWVLARIALVLLA